VNHQSILELITGRETAAAAQAEQLREQIATLAAQLAAVETDLADLATTRATLLQLTGATGDPPPTDAALASTAYQQILAVFATTDSGLRAKDICHALGVGTTANHTERLRAKLKRLVARGVLTEPEPGLFTLAQPTISSPNPTPES
jgi:polyhydroxyalkanoate synthesis regulator phasin